jgi:hypothetical protein
MTMQRFVSLLVSAGICFCPVAFFAQTPLSTSNVAIQWNSAALHAIRRAKLGAPLAARDLAILHTCMYDAWTAYDQQARGTQLSDALRRPVSEAQQGNKQKAISYAAYKALTDLLPVDTNSTYEPLMKELGYSIDNRSIDVETPEGIGNVACSAVLEFRHHDASNQLGDKTQGPYSDWTRYSSVNMAMRIPLQLPSVHAIDPNHWQPLAYVDSSGVFITQMFSTAQWCFVTPFALQSGDESREAIESEAPAIYGTPVYRQQAEKLIEISAHLSDDQKMIAEYWSDTPDGNSAPLRWNEFAQWISARDHHALDDDVKMFFALNNALLDTGIAVWDIKRHTDSARPITAIQLLFHGQRLRAWGGPGKGTIDLDGGQWMPYQPTGSPAPDSPEYVAEQSAFSGAAAVILESWSRGIEFGDSISFAKGSSTIETGLVPMKTITLKLETFQSAVLQAGLASQYGGMNFPNSDIAGQKVGRTVGAKAWSKAQMYFEGCVQPLPHHSSAMNMSAVPAGIR